MDIQEYIDSGIIEDYCLGVLDYDAMQHVAAMATLHPAIQQKIDACENALIGYASVGNAVVPGALKKQLFSIIDNLAAEEVITHDNVPIINKYSDAESWLQYVKPLLPASLNRSYIILELPAADDTERFVVWTNEDVPDETHTDEKETIFILEGRCCCYIGDDVYELAAGDVLSIPLHMPHNVTILNGPVMAVVQREKIAC